jgi:hypothetical protein
MSGFGSLKSLAKGLLSLTVALSAAGCVVAPRERVAPPAPPPAVDPNVYVYPTQGQSPQQLDRDRYECNAWAVQQTGFDPSQASLPARQRVRVVSGPPPGSGVAAGAVTGAVIGAAVSNPWQAGRGALVGAIAGAVIGGVSDAAREEHAAQVEASMNTEASAYQSQRVGDYKRAISACLEARGYQVK